MWTRGRQLDWNMDPLEAQRRWPAGRRLLMLHSGRVHPQWARWSVLAAAEGTFRFVTDANDRGFAQWLDVEDVVRQNTATEQPFASLRQALHDRADQPSLWIGGIAYDVARWIEHLPSGAKADRHGWPVIEMAWCPGWLVFDGVTRQWFACGTWQDGGWPDLSNVAPDATWRCDVLRSASESNHVQAVAKTVDYIRAGDAFQVNLAQRLTANWTGDYPHAHRAQYRRLAQVSPAWYGAYLELASPKDENRRVVASTSPELFLQVGEDGHVVTRPIKGTRPAHVDPAVLRDSEKDQAELHIIVDLLRNDLGRVCEYGSVKVTEPRMIESHPTVHHGVATITGMLHPPHDVVSLLRATMPGGSVTGAPKVRTMQIIDELEPVRRGLYCGSIGLIHVADRQHESAVFNIAIRTMLMETPRKGRVGGVDFSVGGGIVADSDPRAECEETLDKAAAMLAALGLERPKVR
ncbi:MAG: anthranilate synthase component I family protein [Phycisphaeraceae bacterium]|nr:anthranilate synthase component I family protein [Phycisphaeraceae bacterium]